MNRKKRILEAIYEDGIGEPVGYNPSRLYNNFTLPLVRDVSNRLAHVADNDIGKWLPKRKIIKIK